MTKVIGIDIHALNYSQVVQTVLGWIKTSQSRYVCIANVHMLMEAFDSPEYKKILTVADLITPDGMPLVWMMRIKGQKYQERVYGPTLMLHILDAAAREKIPVGFYGGEPEVLQTLIKSIKEQFKSLDIVYGFSPSFSENLLEEKPVVDEINQSGTRILFVGLGCPKQEIWMAMHRNKISAVMLGVGAAFDFHAGVKPQAPSWMQELGLEWLFRLMTEPRRLWKRYFYHNPRFIFLAIIDLLRHFSDQVRL